MIMGFAYEQYQQYIIRTMNNTMHISAPTMHSACTEVCTSLVSKSAVVNQHWPIRTITNDIISIL